MKKKLQMVKNVGTIVLGLGVGTLANNVIKENTPEDAGKINKLCVSLTGIVLVSMVADKVVTYFEEKVDWIANGAKKMVEEESKEAEEA